LFFSTSLSCSGNPGRLTWVRHVQQSKSSAIQSYQCVCSVFVFCDNSGIWLPVLSFLTCAQMWLHAIAHGGTQKGDTEGATDVGHRRGYRRGIQKGYGHRKTDTEREHALRVDSGRKIPCRTGDSNPRQYCAWPCSRTLCQPSYLFRQPYVDYQFCLIKETSR